MAETLHDGDFGPVSLEPFAMLVAIFCLGYVVVKHVFHSERRMAAVGRELETARQIQQSILPKHAPRVPGLSVATHYDSMAEVAGDLFDFVITPAGQLGVLENLFRSASMAAQCSWAGIAQVNTPRANELTPHAPHG